jgi:dipeptidase E
MKLLLTSLGLTNNSISNALSDLIGKDPKDSKIAFVITGANATRGDKNWLIDHMCQIKQYGYHIDIIEIIAMEPTDIEKSFNDVDAIVFGGGNCFYLSYWMQQKGLFEFLPKILETKIYVGISVGSMVAADSFRLSSQALERDENISDEDYNNLGPAGESSAKTLKLVDFVFKPHFNSAEHPEVRNEQYIRSVAHRVNKPIYAIDDQSALKIINGNIEVISEGKWLLLNND